MAVLLRAIVMLVVLVGLPAAWVYYGPLPPEAQSVVDRVVEVARNAIGWEPSTASETSVVSAPHFDSTVIPVAAIEITTTPQPTADSAVFSAPASAPALPSTTAPTSQEKLAPLLQQLREVGAVEYALEKWGRDGQFYRFRCDMPLAQSDQLTQHFEAIHPRSAESIQQVLDEITTWRTARLSGSQY